MPRFIDVLVVANELCGEECALRFKAEDEPRVVTRVVYDGDSGRVECRVFAWSSAGGGTKGPAMAVTVEDSSAGTAILVVGGDWGLRLEPLDGRPAFGETHLRIVAEDVIE